MKYLSKAARANHATYHRLTGEPRQLHELPVPRPVHKHGTRELTFYWEGTDGNWLIMVCPACKQRKALVIP